MASWRRRRKAGGIEMWRNGVSKINLKCGEENQ
jgi:hypothetical protein